MIENKIPISITANAIKEINRLLQIESNNGKGLRIGVRGGGCAGFTYILDFDMQKENAWETTKTFNPDGLAPKLKQINTLTLS